MGIRIIPSLLAVAALVGALAGIYHWVFARGEAAATARFASAAENERELRTIAGRQVEVEHISAERAIDTIFDSLEQEARHVPARPVRVAHNVASAPAGAAPATVPETPAAQAAAADACFSTGAMRVWNNAHAAFAAALAAAAVDGAVPDAAAAHGANGGRDPAEPRADVALVHAVRAGEAGSVALDRIAERTSMTSEISE